MSYKIYLDKEETFECEASIKNSSYKNAKARLIIESDNLNLVFYGDLNKNTISVPVKSLKKYFSEKDTAKIKLEVIVENQLVTPWESDVEFETYNKVEIKEVKNTTNAEPLVEIKLNESVQDNKAMLLTKLNEQLKKINQNGKLTKTQKKQLLKNILTNGL